MRTIELNDLNNRTEVSEQEQSQVTGGLLPAVIPNPTAAAKDHKNWINVASCNMGGHK